MGSYGTYSSTVKLQSRFPKFSMEDLPLGRIAALVPEFVVKDLPLGRTLNNNNNNNNTVIIIINTLFTGKVKAIRTSLPLNH